MGNLSNNYFTGLRFPTGAYASLGARSAVALNSAFVFNVSGAALAIRYEARSTAPIDELYVFVDTATGTPANITLACDIRNESAASVTQPGTTIRASATNVALGTSALKWLRFVFPTPYSPAAIGEVLWFLLRNVSVTPTVDFPSMLAVINVGPASNANMWANQLAFSSATSGFNSAGTQQLRTPFVVRQGGKSFGFATTTLNAAVLASGTALRGFQITPTIDIEVGGWATTIASALMTGIRIYDNATPPAGSPLYTFALGTDTNQSRDELIGAKIWSPFILSGGTTYNVVTSWSAAATIGGASIEDYTSFPAIFDDLIDGFVNCWPVSDVGGVWTLTKSGFLNQQLLISGFPMSGSRASYALGM